MNEEVLINMENSIRSLREALLVNSLTNIVNSPLYSDEVRKEAVMRVENLLGLSASKDFVQNNEPELPSNVIR